MGIYLITFAISTLLFYLASKVESNNGSIALSLIAMVPPIFIAGMRDPDVGIDIFTYGYDVWNAACSSGSWSSFYSWYGDTSIEIGYLVVNFIVSRFSTDIHVFFAVHEFLLLLFIILTAKKLKTPYLLWFLPLFFYLYLYNESLSMLRQSLAVMMGLYVSTFIFEKKIIPFYIGCIICYLFHHSAAFMFMLYPIAYLVRRFRNKKITLLILIVLGTLVVISFYQLIMNSLISAGLADAKYEMYVGDEGNKTHKVDLAFLAAITLMLLIFVKKKQRLFPDFYFTVFFTIIGFSMTLLGSLVEVANRAAYYIIVPLSYMVTETTIGNSKRKLLLTSFIILLAVRFFYLAITTQTGGTIPYKSMLLDYLL